LNEFKYHETEFGLVNMHNTDIKKKPIKNYDSLSLADHNDLGHVMTYN
jgi:hypothetical protein